MGRYLVNCLVPQKKPVWRRAGCGVDAGRGELRGFWCSRIQRDSFPEWRQHSCKREDSFNHYVIGNSYFLFNLDYAAQRFHQRRTGRPNHSLFRRQLADTGDFLLCGCRKRISGESRTNRPGCINCSARSNCHYSDCARCERR